MHGGYDREKSGLLVLADVTLDAAFAFPDQTVAVWTGLVRSDWLSTRQRCSDASSPVGWRCRAPAGWAAARLAAAPPALRRPVWTREEEFIRE